MKIKEHPGQDFIINTVKVVGVIMVIFSSAMILWAGGYIAWFVIANFVLLIGVLAKLKDLKEKK